MSCCFYRPTLYDSYIAVESSMVSTKLPYFWTSIPWEGPGGLLEIARSTGIFNAKMEHGYSGINLNYADEQYVKAKRHFEWTIDLMLVTVFHSDIPTSPARFQPFHTTNSVSSSPSTTIHAGWAGVPP